MCGIAGIVGGPAPIERIEATLRGLVRDLHHRGPDDNGIWIAPKRDAGLCATRLAILDLSPAGHQPMSSTDGRYTIVFNGEIFNFRELRQQLLEQGSQFRSKSDTEVVLQLYLSLGAACVSKLRGMFAFAVWDSKEKTCLLARDPLGIKPLYYFADEARGELLFSSELKSLLRTGRIPKRLCDLGLYGFFRSGSVPEPFTLIEGVRCLEAGAVIFWERGAAKHHRYWQLGFEGFDEALSSEVKAAEATRAALLDSVAHHFVSDVPVGVFLSGGLDSTALIALARITGQQGQLRTFSVGTDDESSNEAGLASRTAEHFGTEHAELSLTAAKAKELFPEFLQAIDQPTVNGFNTFAVSKLAHQANMKVVLSGLGADEIFGGYPSFQRLPTMITARKRFDRIPFGKSIVRGIGRQLLSNRWSRLAEFLAGPGTLVSAYRSLRGIFTMEQSNRLVTHYTGLRQELVDEMLTAPEFSHSECMADRVSRMEIELYMRNQLLRDSDVMSMANELELRVPFVDQCLIEILAKVPVDIRIHNRKKLLLEAVPEIPSWIAELPKRGFSLPFQQWRARDWFPRSSNGRTPPTVAGNSWYQHWTISILETWLQEIA
jgi:asparagine synthase (glutamine-hydrolysing)